MRQSFSPKLPKSIRWCFETALRDELKTPSPYLGSRNSGNASRRVLGPKERISEKVISDAHAATARILPNSPGVIRCPTKNDPNSAYTALTSSKRIS